MMDHDGGCGVEHLSRAASSVAAVEGWWLSLSEADAIGVDGGVMSALGLEETHQGSDTEDTEDTVVFEGQAGAALGETSDRTNPEDPGDSHGADTGNWILATERQEDSYGNAGAHRESQQLKRPACFVLPLPPQEPDVFTPPLGTMPGIIRRKRANKPSGTRPKAHHAQHGAAASPGQTTAVGASFSICDPMSFHALAWANGFHMASSLVMAHETHWAQSQAALKYAASAQRYDSPRIFPHLQCGPVVTAAQLPEAVPEPYRQCFFSPHNQAHQNLQLKAQSKAQSIEATSPSHLAEDKNARETTGGGGGNVVAQVIRLRAHESSKRVIPRRILQNEQCQGIVRLGRFAITQRVVC
jgi:hypothetical protein